MPRSISVEQSPWYDPSGVDLLGTRYTFDIMTVVSAATIAQQFLFAPVNDTAVPQRLPLVLPAGAVAPQNTAQLAALVRQVLNTPRKTLVYGLFNGRTTDVMVRSPRDDTYPTDARGGPTPEGVKVVEVIGDKSLIVMGRWVTHLADYDRPLLSNRWSVRCDVSIRGLTARLVTGQAVIDLGAFAKLVKAKDATTTADSYRSALLLPIPPGFERSNVVVKVREDGATVDYSYTDTEVILGIESADAVEVEGNYTSGLAFNQKTLQGRIKQWAGGLKKVVALDFGGLAEDLLDSSIPVAMASAYCRVKGTKTGPNADREDYGALAVGVCVDRLAPFQKDPTIVSCFVTFDVKDHVFAEARLEALPGWDAQQIGIEIDPYAVPRAMRTNNPVRVGLNGPAFLEDLGARAAPSAGFGNDLQTRGSYLGALFTQALADPSAAVARARDYRHQTQGDAPA